MTADSERDPQQEHPTAPHEHGHSLYEAGEFLDAPPAEEIPEREVSLRRRLLNVRTIGSVIFGVALLYLLFRFVLNLDFAATWQRIANADLRLLAAAFVVYYLTFPLRGYRWAYVLGKVGTRVRFRDSTEILFLSWFVNCLVPAKLGDLYRAWLLKGNFGASISRSVGTIFIERIADLLVIFALALAAGFWSFRNLERPEVNALLLAGFVVAMVLVALVIGLRWWGDRITRFLPVRAREFYERFHEGSTGAVTARAIPTIVLLTGMIWVLEGLRLYFVIRALDLPTVNLGISSAIFVTLAGSLLTAIPLTPAGVGFVEAGIVGALWLYGVTQEPAAAVALTDRAISILTVIVLGGIAYAFSAKVRRAHGIGPAAAEGAG
ncbi:MAG TPA: lysylphosphatidylglycerol synthase transmembrane domain-containing protein [Candidatus Limnocylindria bacterium]